MPCEPLVDKNGKINGFICSRSKVKEKPKLCYICGKPSTKLCDFRDGGIRTGKDDYGRTKKHPYTSLDTCDKPMCDDCTNHIEPDTDYCADHYNQFCIKKTKMSQGVYNKMIEKFDND